MLALTLTVCFDLSDDTTRVVMDTDGDNPSDYINASHITVSRPLFTFEKNI